MNINYYNPYVRQELELYHHGIAGMKWGKRNGPPYPLSAGAHSVSENKAGWRKSLAGTQTIGGARKYTKELNKNDKRLATARYDKHEELQKAAKYQSKADKIASKGGSDKKVAKLHSKAKEHLQNAAMHEKSIKKAQKRADELVKYLSAQGYTMKSKKTTRMVHVGRSIAQSVLTNIALSPLSLATPVSVKVYKGHFISGTKYKVKKTKANRKQTIQRNDDKNYENTARNSTVLTNLEIKDRSNSSNKHR